MVFVTLSTYKYSIPELSASKWIFINRETDFRDDSNVKALAGLESDFSNKDQEWDAETLYNGENGFSTEDYEIGADSNREVLSDEAIWAMVEYSGLDFIVLNL